MNEAIVYVTRVFFTLLVPCVLLVPLVVTVRTPNQASTEAKRETAKILQSALIVFTLLALATWLGLTLIGMANQLRLFHPLQQLSLHCWGMFFPLWFGLAMPCIRAKSPTAPIVERAFFPNATLGETRSASLVNRLRQPLLDRWEWGVGAAVSIACLGVIAARGLAPFDSDLTQGISRGIVAHWLLALGIYAMCVTTQWIVVPISLRAMLIEPEPMDAQGSPELQEAYRSYRMLKARGLFWMLAVILPAFLGMMIAVMVWMPGYSRSLGWLGGLGGTCLGFCGAAFGSWMTHRRIQIDKLRLELDRPQHAAGSPTS